MSTLAICSSGTLISGQFSPHTVAAAREWSVGKEDDDQMRGCLQRF